MDDGEVDNDVDGEVDDDEDGFKLRTKTYNRLLKNTITSCSRFVGRAQAYNTTNRTYHTIHIMYDSRKITHRGTYL